MKISESEILEAMRAAVANVDSPEGAFTVGDVVASTGWSVPRIRGHLLALKQQGQLEVVSVVRESLDGRQRSVAAYRLKGRAAKPPKRAA